MNWLLWIPVILNATAVALIFHGEYVRRQERRLEKADRMLREWKGQA